MVIYAYMRHIIYLMKKKRVFFVCGVFWYLLSICLCNSYYCLVIPKHKLEKDAYTFSREWLSLFSPLSITFYTFHLIWKEYSLSSIHADCTAITSRLPRNKEKRLTECFLFKDLEQQNNNKYWNSNIVIFLTIMSKREPSQKWEMERSIGSLMTPGSLYIHKVYIL